MQLFAPSPPRLDGATLLLPAVAFANIGELAIDALVASLDLQRVAAADNPNALPCVGNNPYHPTPPGTLATAIELYGTSASAPLYLLQQRAPVITGRQRHFAAELAAWAAAAGVSRVVVLAGLDSQFRRERQMEGSQLRWLSKGDTATADACRSLGFTEMEPEALEIELAIHDLLPPWPELAELEKAGVPVTLLGTWASEGDNLPDAQQLAVAVLRLLKSLSLDVGAAADSSGNFQMRTPCSWAGLYGGQIPLGLST